MARKEFQPTRQKLKKALADGKSKRSQLLANSLLSLLVVFGLPRLRCFDWVRIQLLVECVWSQEFSNSGMCVRAVLWETERYFAAFFGLMLLGAMMIQWLQVGSIWVPAAIAPCVDRLNPALGMARIASSLSRLPRTFFLCAGALCVGIFVLSYMMIVQADFFSAQSSNAPPIFLCAAASALQLLCAQYVVFGVIDLVQQRARYREQVFLDAHEMRRELRESDGDPQIKAQRRSLQYALSREELVRQIKRAKVIVVERLPVTSQERKGVS